MFLEAPLPRNHQRPLDGRFMHSIRFGEFQGLRYNVSMERYSRDFKGVWIPKEIWLSDKLSLMEKVLFVEIHSLDNERGCFASNRHFSEFFGVSSRQIATYVASLKAKGFISVRIQNQNERTIRVIGKYARVSEEQLRRFHAEVRQLGDRMSVHGRRGGMKQTSRGV